MEDFAEFLKKLRNDMRLSLRQVAAKAGVSVSYLTQLEHGRRGVPGAPVLKKLAPIYNISTRELLKAAGYLDDDTKPVLSDKEEVDMAFTYVMNDPRYKSGTRFNGELTTDVKRFIVQMYETSTGKKLLPGG